jgi:hypothetical protein
LLPAQELSRAGAAVDSAAVPRAASATALYSAAAPPRLSQATHASSAAAAAAVEDNLAALDRDLPFEFRVLEKALEDVCGALEHAVAELEGVAHPALDDLTRKVTSANLERVKRVKGRMTRTTGRVASVRGEIQRFLDDDSDMRDMYLSRKAAAADAMAPQDGGGGGGGQWGHAGHALLDPMDDDADIQQLEDLLETYFAQIDHAFNKMKALDEYVGSTEDYINIDLDSHRNQLIQIDLLLSFAMFITSLFTLVTGIFGARGRGCGMRSRRATGRMAGMCAQVPDGRGRAARAGMNLNSGLQDDPRAFNEVTGISTALVRARKQTARGAAAQPLQTRCWDCHAPARMCRPPSDAAALHCARVRQVIVGFAAFVWVCRQQRLIQIF